MNLCLPRTMATGFASLIAVCVLAVSINPQPNVAWKRRNDRGNRYEGVVSIQTGNPDLEVVAFTGSFEPFTGNANLRVRFFVPPAASPLIVAHEFEEEKQYWMEVKPQNWKVGSWNEFYPWPTGDVIVRERIAWNNVAVIIRLAGNQLAPAFVYHQNPPPNPQSYVIHLRSNRNLGSVRVTVSGTSSQDAARTVSLPRQTANIPFPIRFDLSGFPEGRTRIKVERTRRDSPQPLPVHEYEFYHKRRF